MAFLNCVRPWIENKQEHVLLDSVLYNKTEFMEKLEPLYLPHYH